MADYFDPSGTTDHKNRENKSEKIDQAINPMERNRDGSVWRFGKTEFDQIEERGVEEVANKDKKESEQTI
jgi:hypothetical protein